MAILYAIHLFDRFQCKRTLTSNYSLPARHWGISIDSQKHLIIQNCDAVTLADRYGTPLYVVDKKRLEDNYLHFYSSFAKKFPRVEVAYSYKTNPLPRVINVLHKLGASAEVISEFELWLALKLGVTPEKIVYNGPGKTKKGLELAVSKNVKLINIDNLSEIDLIDALAGKYGVRQGVGVRVVTSVGWSSQFGLSIQSKKAFEAFQRLKNKKNLNACGLHIHLGTGIQSVETYLQAIKEVLDFSKMLERELGVGIEYFDFGGGFGVPTVRPYSEIDFKLMLNDFPPRMTKFKHQTPLEKYTIAITDLVHKYYPMDNDRFPTIIFEPGRAITSSAQLLLLEVIAVKNGTDRTDNVILNGGKNITMPMGYEYHEIFAASKMMEPPTSDYNLFGPLCHPGDVLFIRKKLPTLVPGDILAVMDAGAYFVPNQMNFSNPRPAAVMVDSGQEELIRKHESFEDIIARDVL
jgi:diaminopimelate decarboxylase